MKTPSLFPEINKELLSFVAGDEKTVQAGADLRHVIHFIVLPERPEWLDSLSCLTGFMTSMPLEYVFVVSNVLFWSKPTDSFTWRALFKAFANLDLC